ncbi:peroxiredoxin family protein [Pseudoalteromonas sp. T1lg23B]|uniref:peroxiredoxin family protein n=1 Tax=Pseudoalteromonas sp. T1lg23B TaxID=2077097 RepID=UPI000CF73605|nr:redoxin family protein [Pseudoalteromonas sp. T1lg23B]
MKFLILLLLPFTAAMSYAADSALPKELQLSTLQTVDGNVIAIDHKQTTHFIFSDIWAMYNGGGDVDIEKVLPNSFLTSTKRVWIQPQFNVTEVQIKKFQGYFPQIKPLVLDKELTLMRKMGVWDRPYHVLVQNDEITFSGNTDELKQHLGLKTNKAQPDVSAKTEPATKEATHVKDVKLLKHIKVGDPIAHFAKTTITNDKLDSQSLLAKLEHGQKLNLVFMDSLCPMPKFPNCAAQLEQLKKQIENNSEDLWVGIANSFYVDANYVKQFADKFALDLPIIFDQDNEIFKAYNVYSTPYKIEVNKLGIIDKRGSKF